MSDEKKEPVNWFHRIAAYILTMAVVGGLFAMIVATVIAYIKWVLQ